jgi:secreted trypsin-like serine protease
MDPQSRKWIQEGIVSNGPLACGSSDFPGVSTKVQPFVPWILSKMNI